MLHSRPRLSLITLDAELAVAVRRFLGDSFDIDRIGSGRHFARARSIASEGLILDEEIVDTDECARLRALAGPELPIVVLARARSSMKAAIRFLEAGANDVLSRQDLGLPDHTGRCPSASEVSELLAKVSGRFQSVMRGAAALRRARADVNRLARAQQLAHIVSWRYVQSADRLLWSDNVTSILGLPAPRDIDYLASLLEWVHPADRVSVARAMVTPVPHRIEYRLVLSDGQTRTVQQEAEVATDADPGGTALIGTVQDITALREAERQADSLAYFDRLTGLPNRTLLRRYLQRAVARARPPRDRAFTVLLLGLDGFKRLNGTLGPSAGDKLLCEVAARLLRIARELASCDRDEDPDAGIEAALAGDAFAARFGGDEFAVVVEGPTPAANVARRIEEALARSFEVLGSEVYVSSSIGIACFPGDGGSVDELIERAAAALHHAKERGPNNCQFFSADLIDKARRRMTIENRLRAAVKRAEGAHSFDSLPPTFGPQELTLVYQPKIEIPSNRLVGVEALMRWTSPHLGPVSPAEFIPIAEETGLIAKLGELALFTACARAKSWPGPERLNVSVNVSARQFREPTFAATVRAALEQTGLPPQCLELELTENVVMPDPAASRAILQDLKSLGVRIALDDFGTGYSSLNYLAKLPIDVLKIDRSFVTDMHRGDKTGLITSAIIALARALEIEVVVEGVETEEQVTFLAQHGTLAIQGYHFAKPMPFDALTAWRPPRPTTREASGVYHFPLPLVSNG